MKNKVTPEEVIAKYDEQIKNLKERKRTELSKIRRKRDAEEKRYTRNIIKFFKKHRIAINEDNIEKLCILIELNKKEFTNINSIEIEEQTIEKTPIEVFDDSEEKSENII